MSNPYTGAVASALRKAELLLSTDSSAALKRTALQEAAVLQLWRGYRAFLAELAWQLQLGPGGQGVQPESAHALADLASAGGKYCAEATELCELGAAGDSWLAQLQAAWVALWCFGGEREAAQPQAVQLIPLQDVSARAELSADSLRAWHSALAELVRRQRSQSQEY